MRALLSVYDKTGIVDLARGLRDLGVEIVSTGGTLSEIRAGGIDAAAVADVTAFPEILGGRVKTLHPAIHGGLLARQGDAGHLAEILAHGIVPIDVVACNLYPFEATIAQPRVGQAEAIEQIDIGGPAMIRAAAKNYESVAVLTSPTQYGSFLEELAHGTVVPERRRRLAATAFAHVATYDTVVADYLRTVAGPPEFPDEITIAGRKTYSLRYGENPHQAAAAYRRLSVGGATCGLLDARQLAGKELSFNNLLDADAAWAAVSGHAEPAVAIVKHTIPCGLAVRSDLCDAFAMALAGDPVSAFGGIVAMNRSMDGDTARAVAAIFVEVVVAPGFSREARDALASKRHLRLLEMPSAPAPTDAPPWEVRPIQGGLLVQTVDADADDPANWEVVTQRAPTGTERADLAFAWQAVRRVTSNAIVLARETAIVGVGSGQPNRLESVRIAVDKAGDRAHGSVLGSDAFFPFADGIEAAAAAGVAVIVQPGGSIRDEETIAAADAAGLAMVHTGVRHFRH